MTFYVLAYLIGLPISVWMLAALCAVVDEPRKVQPLLRLTAAICVVLAVLLLTQRALLMPLALAFGTIVVAHAAGFWLIRTRGTGAPIHEPAPPSPPLLEDET